MAAPEQTIPTNNYSEKAERGENYETAINQLLECSVCLETFQDPRNLNCQHTFCLRCLIPLLKVKIIYGINLPGQIECPICRATTQIRHDEDIQALRRDLTMVNLLSIEKKKMSSTDGSSVNASEKETKQQSLRLCGVCGERELIFNFCKTCTLDLCLRCSETHAKYADCKNPFLVAIAVVEEESRSQIKHTCKSVEDVLERFKDVTNEHMSIIFDKRKENIKTQIQSESIKKLHIIEAQKDSCFDQVDNYYKKKGDFVIKSVNEIKSRKRKLETLKNNLAETVEIYDSLYIESTTKKANKEVDEFIKFMEKESVVEETLSTDLTLTRNIAGSLKLLTPKQDLEGTDVRTSHYETTFEIIIENISKMEIGKKKETPDFVLRDLPWYVLLKKNANHEKNALGVYLTCSFPATPSNVSCQAQCELQLLNWNNGGGRIVKKLNRKFQQTINGEVENCWGYREFVDWNVLVCPNNGYTKDDTVKIEVCVKAEKL